MGRDRDGKRNILMASSPAAAEFAHTGMRTKAPQLGEQEQECLAAARKSPDVERQLA